MEGLTVCYVNGINTTFAEGVDEAAYISDRFGGIDVEYVPNVTTGNLYRDAVRAVKVKEFSDWSAACENLLETYQQIRGAMGENEIIIIVGFSEGNIVANSVLQEIGPGEARKNVSNLGICPGAITKQEACKNPINLVNPNPLRDPVPHIGDLLRSVMPCLYWGKKLVDHFVNPMGDPIISCESHKDAERFDHSVKSPTYQEKIERYFKNIMKEFGLSHEDTNH
jgi:hypothetical protein